MTVRKRIPRDEESFDLMLQNMDSKCDGYRVPLNISTEQLTTLATNAASYHGWRLLKSQFSDTKTSITNFVEILFSGNKKAPLPPTPGLTFDLPPLPAKPGIEKQTNEFIEYLEMQDNFTPAIGQDLGFYEEVADVGASEEKTAEFSAQNISGYQLKITFSLQKQNALRLSYRVKGTTAWTHETLTNSPYILELEPDPNGNAVTLEMQARLIKNNKPVGNLSDLKTVIARA